MLFEAIVWIVVGTLTAFRVTSDWRRGEMILPRRGGRRNRRPLQRAEYPLIFVTILGLKVAAAVLLTLLLTGRLMPLIQWGA